MIQVGTCRHCDQELAEASADGVCPRCRKQGGTAHPAEAADNPTARGERATIEFAVEPFDPLLPTRQRRFGEYELLAEIAQGGMGLVYKARHVSLNRIVALKVIRAGQLATVEDVERFRIEAKAAAHLDHPRIVPIYEVGEKCGIHYFTMKLVEGGNLAELMPRYVANPAAGARLIAAAARGIHYAHQRGILHRDLKPANVLIDAEGRPHVADFGVAKRMGVPSPDGSAATVAETDDATLSGGIVGTPGYMAPEQAAGARDGLTLAVDVYSLGAILYEMLTGRPPFSGGTQLATLKQVLECTPIPPRQLQPRVDRLLEAITLKCLARDPQDRYASAAALADDLERWLARQPISALHLPAIRRGYLWARRHPITAALTFALLLIVTTACLGISIQSGQRRHAVLSADHYAAEAMRAHQLAQQAQARVEELSFGECLRLAHRFLLAGKAGEARAYLEFASPAHRDWEWHLLARACLAASLGPDNHVPRAANDGAATRLLLRSSRGRIVFVDPISARMLGVLDGVFEAACPWNDVMVLTLDQAWNVACWDVATGAKTYQLAEQATALATIPGRAVLLGSADGEVRVLDDPCSGPSRVLRVGGGAVKQLAASRDGRWLLTRCAGEPPKTWSTADWRQAAVFADCSPDARVLDLSEGGRLALVSLPGGVTRVWDARMGVRGPVLAGHVERIVHGLFLPGGRRVITLGDRRETMVWDCANGQELLNLPSRTALIADLAATRDGLVVAIDVEDQPLVWDGRPVVWH